jgi:hypothetical protein
VLIRGSSFYPLATNVGAGVSFMTLAAHA